MAILGSLGSWPEASSPAIAPCLSIPRPLAMGEKDICSKEGTLLGSGSLYYSPVMCRGLPLINLCTLGGGCKGAIVLPLADYHPDRAQQNGPENVGEISYHNLPRIQMGKLRARE